MIYFKCLIWIICEMFLQLEYSVQTYVTWKSETKIIRLGETVVLACTVHAIDAIKLSKTRQWSKESRLVCYNGNPTNPLKYMEYLQRNTFKLFIYNVTEADLNCEYQCLYSFETFSKNLDINEENFEYLPPENITELIYNYTRKGNLSVKLSMKKVFPLPKCKIEFQTFQLTFTKRQYKKKGLYFEVDFLYQSHIVFNESTQFNVTCQLQQQYLIATKIIEVQKGGTKVDVSDEHAANYVVILFLVLGILVVLGIVVTVVYYIVKRRTSGQNVEGIVEIYDEGNKTFIYDGSSYAEEDDVMYEIPREEGSTKQQLCRNIERQSSQVQIPD